MIWYVQRHQHIQLIPQRIAQDFIKSEDHCKQIMVRFRDKNLPLLYVVDLSSENTTLYFMYSGIANSFKLEKLSDKPVIIFKRFTVNFIYIHN